MFLNREFIKDWTYTTLSGALNIRFVICHLIQILYSFGWLSLVILLLSSRPCLDFLFTVFLFINNSSFTWCFSLRSSSIVVIFARIIFTTKGVTVDVVIIVIINLSMQPLLLLSSLSLSSTFSILIIIFIYQSSGCSTSPASHHCSYIIFIILTLNHISLLFLLFLRLLLWFRCQLFDFILFIVGNSAILTLWVLLHSFLTFLLRLRMISNTLTLSACLNHIIITLIFIFHFNIHIYIFTIVCYHWLAWCVFTWIWLLLLWLNFGISKINWSGFSTSGIMLRSLLLLSIIISGNILCVIIPSSLHWRFALWSWLIWS